MFLVLEEYGELSFYRNGDLTREVQEQWISSPWLNTGMSSCSSPRVEVRLDLSEARPLVQVETADAPAYLFDAMTGELARTEGAPLP